MNTIFLVTECCNVSDTTWDNVHVCRGCGVENPFMVEVSTDEHYACCFAPKYLGHMYGCPNSVENFLPREG